jgi:hypothetical protein
VRIYAAVEAPGQMKDGMKLRLPPKLVEKLPVSFYKISFPVTHLMAYYAETGRSHPLIA